MMYLSLVVAVCLQQTPPQFPIRPDTQLPVFPVPPQPLPVFPVPPQEIKKQPKEVKVKVSFPKYEDVAQKAYDLKMPVVVFVNCTPRKIEGAIVCSDKQFADMNQGVVVGRPSEQWFTRFDLPVNATDEQIKFKAFKK